jgi:two-component sensor histidine kinase
MQAMYDHIEGRAAVYETAYRIQTSSGDYLWFRDVGRITRRTEIVPGEMSLTVTGMVVDITRQMHTEDTLREREEHLKEALAEKEILLSEIHHRVKNNLTALISLLSLEGSYEETPAGKAIKKDLQDRARSMALIHETLYQTHQYGEVDMGVYLTNLTRQLVNSFTTTKTVKIAVDAHGVMLGISRATPAGLIINELVTNSFKYAFPESFDALTVRQAPPTISISLTKNDEEYVMAVKDNGVGLPPGFDLATTRTLGLKLVNFLAKHQMQRSTQRMELNIFSGSWNRI